MPKFVMSDGREFTDFQPSCTLNEMIQNKYNIKNSHEYRYFLQKNAEKVMKDLADCDTKQGCTLCPVCKQSLDLKDNVKPSA
jgi:hypothetical protein